MVKLIEWINKNTPIFIMTTSQLEIGNTADEIHFGLMYARRAKKKILILRLFQIFGFPKTCNKEIYRIETPYSFGRFTPFLQFVGNLVLTITYGHIPITFKYVVFNTGAYFRFLFQRSSHPEAKFKIRKRWSFYDNHFFGTEYLWNPKPGSSFSWEIANSVNWAEEFAKDLSISLNAKKSEIAKVNLQRMGISPSDWYVCLHVREGGFYSDHNSVRNCSIKNYLDGIKAITDAGGWVVRMGDKSMTPLPKMDRVVDYPFTTFKSEFMDIYLIKNCRLYIGQNSGVIEIARLFHKKLVAVNATELLTCLPLRKNELVIPKHLFSKKMNRYLSVKEVMSGTLSSFDWGAFNEVEYFFTENSPKEIKDVILESILVEATATKTTLRGEFNRLRICKMHQVLDANTDVIAHERPPYSRDGWNNILRFRIASQTEGALGTLGRGYLEKNWEWDALNSDESHPHNLLDHRESW